VPLHCPQFTFHQEPSLKLNPTFAWEAIILTTPKTSLFSDSHGV